MTPALEVLKLDRGDNLIVHNDPKSPAAEAFRTLRTNIQFTAFDTSIKRILVTSAGPADGKSTIAMNLAAAIAQTGKGCTLVDCDLRRPVLHKEFGLVNRRGLVNLLLGDASVEDACFSTGIPGLKVVTSGPIPPNPAELVGSVRMDDIMEKISSETDMVIVDCPPVMAVTDALSVATKVDGVLLVVSAGSTPRQLALGAKNALEGVGARVLGVVLNRVDFKSGYGYYNYHNYYNYYGSSDNT